jgi:hypothetical protein
MFWRGQILTDRLILTLSLFLIGSLHTMIFAIFQLPDNFLLGHASKSLEFSSKAILYFMAVGTSACHQILCRKMGLRKTLYFGLLCNLIGTASLWLNQTLNTQNHLAFIYLDMVFFGLALTSVINSLVTYIVIEFPKKVGTGIVALFAFLNLGAMLGPLLQGLFRHLNVDLYTYPFLILLLCLAIWFVHVYFFDPPFPAHLVHLRKGTLIWKELHYRLGLYILAIIAYGLTESTFSIWGYAHIKHLLGTTAASDATSFFWLFLIVGQIFLLLPLYFLPAKRIFYPLILIIMGAGAYFSLQHSLFGFIGGLAAAGFGCSAIFPILLSMMEKEILPFARGKPLLFFIELIVSLMLGGYFLGVGINDLWITLYGERPLLSPHFNLAILYIGITGLITLFLNLTLAKK